MGNSSALEERRMRYCRLLGSVASVGILILAPETADGAFHLWKIDQVYSDASGTVQFVELFTPFDGENVFLSGAMTFASNTNTYHFDHDPPFNTGNHHLLLATPGFIAL